MTTAILPRAEWAAALVGTELEAVHPLLPEGAQIVVVEDGGRVIACWALFPMLHIEGCWIAPEQRGNPRVALKLLRGMQHAALGMGASVVATAATDPGVADMLDRLGAVELPGRHYSLCVDAKNPRK